MLRSVYLLIASLDLSSLLLSTAVAQARWQIGTDAAFLFKQYHSADAGGVFKPNFVTATAIGGLHVSRSLPNNTIWLEMGIIYTPLDVSVATAGSSGYRSVGGGLWIIPTLVRKEITFPLFTQRDGRRRSTTLSISAGIQHQILSNASKLIAGRSSGYGAGYGYSDRTAVIHRYNPALFVEPAIRFHLIRHRLDLLFRLNATLGLRDLIRTNIDYSVAAGGASQRATVSYKGSGTGWGLGLRYLVY